MRISTLVHALTHAVTVSAFLFTNLTWSGSLPARPAEQRCYVYSAAKGAKSGADWANAYTDLQSALGGSPCTEIWVAEGIYTPTVPSGRNSTFELKDGVDLYGGFAGDEDSRDARDWTANPTILSGDIDHNDMTVGGVITDTAQINGENAYHVVSGIGIGTGAVLDGFTITAGNANPATIPGQWGGGMFVEDSKITIRNVIFQGNYAVGGGGIFINLGWELPGQPELVNVLFSQNHARLNGGGLHTHNWSSPTLEDVTFTGNSAEDRGGGMYNLNGSSPTLTGVTFSGNEASFHGGGMYNENNSNPTLADVTFNQNTAVYNGAGMYNWRSSPRLVDVAFSENVASESGGGMFNYDSSAPMLESVTFFRNHAGASGGGMFNLFLSSPVLNNALFAHNSAAASGGGIFNAASSPALMNVTLYGNRAQTGGGMYNDDESYPSLANSIVWSNTAPTGRQIYNALPSNTSIAYSDIQDAFIGGLWDGSLGAYEGGNLDVDPQFVDVASSNLRLRPASPVIDAGDNLRLPADAGDLDGDDNTAEPSPYDLDSSPRMVNYTGIAAPTVDLGAYEAQLGPAIIYVDQEAPGAVHDGTAWAAAFPDLQTALAVANGENEIWVAAGVYTPGITGNISATFQLKNGVALYGGFSGTEATRGARDWTVNDTILSGDLSGDDLTESGVVTGTDRIEGKNAYHVVTGSGTNATAVLDGFTITAGDAGGTADSVFLSSGQPTFDGITPTLTGASFTADPAQTGGGLYNDSGSPTLINLAFTVNAAIAGGGIYNRESSPTLTGVTFRTNRADFGGGMYNYSGSRPSLTEVAFWENSALTGGGMYNSSSSPTLAEVTFSSNTADISGGGMVNASNSNPSLASTTFSANSARYFGGGMLCWNSSPALTNVTFSGNQAENGGGMFNNASIPTLTNITFSGNSATVTGGGISNRSSGPILTNVILWGSTPDQIYNDDSAPVVSYSLVQGGYTGTGNLSGDPLLEGLADNGGMTLTHALRSGSPAIDAGDPLTCPAADQRGLTRPMDGDANWLKRCDIGAYEVQSTTEPHLYLPLLVR